MNVMRLILDFCKRFTLPVAMAAGAAAYFTFASVPQLAGCGLALGTALSAVVPWLLFLVLFITFCRVDFRQLRPVRWHFCLLAVQVVMAAAIVVPVVALGLSGDALVIMECLLACIIGPCAAAAAVVTGKLGGSVESMTTYTFLSNFLTALLIPVAFPLIEPGADIGFAASALMILYKVCVVLVVPMGLAWVVKHHFRRLLAWILARPDLSFYLWGCTLAIVTGQTMRNIVHSGASAAMLVAIAALSLVLCMVQFAVGRRVGRRFGHAIDAGQGLGQKNTAFAIWISSAYLNPLASVGPGCYILWQNAVNSLELWRAARSKA